MPTVRVKENESYEAALRRCKKGAKKAEDVRIILDPALPPRHLTKSAIKAAVKHVLKATTNVAS